MSEFTYRIAFIGAGRMASAMILSLLRSGRYLPNELACCSANDGTAESLVQQSGIGFINPEASESFRADAWVLACKPQQLASLSPHVIASAAGSLLISILAGTPIGRLSAKFPDSRNIVRVMPNTPGSVGAGMSAYAAQQKLAAADRVTVESLLESMGVFLEVQESELDAITAVSGSGPAYLFLFVEALRDAAIEQGFSREVASMLAQQTIVGSAKLLDQSGLSPEELRRQVTSPGGTTQAAIDCFQAEGFGRIVANAVQSANIRSIELGRLT